MEAFTLKPTAIHVVRIDPGEDVLETLGRAVRERGVRQAVVLGGYGTLASWSLHWVTHNRIPSENRFATGEGGIEIPGMGRGTVSRLEAIPAENQAPESFGRQQEQRHAR